jgi:uncharacterized membrane protein
VLTVAMAVGSVWMLRFWNDVKGETEEKPTRPDDLLGPLAQAFAAGQMSEEEYQRIKQSLGLGGSRPVPPKPRPTPDPPPPPDVPA